MGIPKRSGVGGPFTVSIQPLAKTCPEEAGIWELNNLPDGTTVAVIAHAFWPSHDESLVEVVKEFLADRKPDLLLMLGGMLHEEAFKQVVDAQDDVQSLIYTGKLPEIAAIRREHEGLEERFLALARKGGEFIASFVEAGARHVVYIPSVSGTMPNEIDIMRFVRTQKEMADRRIDQWVDKHGDKYPDDLPVKGEEIPREFADFIGLSDNPDVTVLPFGAAVRLNSRTRFLVGDFRRKHPGAASQEDATQLGEDIVRSFDGKAASTWWTLPVHSLGESKRRYCQAHEVPNLFDITKQLGYLRNVDRRTKGLWFGTVFGGTLFGTAIPALHGVDGRRSLFIDDTVYEERAATPRARVHSMELAHLSGGEGAAEASGGSARKSAAPARKATAGARKAPAKSTTTQRKTSRRKS